MPYLGVSRGTFSIFWGKNVINEEKEKSANVCKFQFWQYCQNFLNPLYTFQGRNIFTVFMEEIFIMNSKGHNTKWDQ